MKALIKKYFTVERIFNLNTLIAIIIFTCIIIAHQQIYQLIQWFFTKPMRDIIITVTSNEQLIISIVTALSVYLFHKK